MSLINDALKRAKQTQQENPPATPALEFRPVEPIQANRPIWLLSLGLTLVILAIVGLSGVLVWYVKQSEVPLPVAAREINQPAPPPAPKEAVSAQVGVTPPTPAVATNPLASPALIPPPPQTETNTVAATAPGTAATPPPPIKLQGLFFNPQNPAAVINGKTLHLGSRVGGFRVLAISPMAVTLVSATETNVLSLSE